ncbi:MAG: hypothetical protein ACE14M_01120 [Terriglobales bacterium]
MKVRKVVGFVLLMAMTMLAAEEKRGPSTPEERKRAIEITKKLEADPLDPALKSDRSWLVQWIVEIPDIVVPVCEDVLAPALKEQQWRYKYSSELLAQQLAGSAVYLIEHPDATEDDFDISKAGLESALNAYQALMKKHAKGARWLPLDDLLNKRNKGELDDYVRQKTMRCLSGRYIMARSAVSSCRPLP